MRNVGKHLRNQWAGVLALFLVLTGGTAWAATNLTKNSVRSGHIVNGQVKTPDLKSGAVKPGKLATNAVRRRHIKGAAVNRGKLAPQARGVLAYAYIESDGSVENARSRGISAGNVVKATVPGRYCLKDLDLPSTPVTAQVTGPILESGEPDVIGTVTVKDPSSTLFVSNCGGEVDAAIETYDIGAGALADRAFQVWLQD